MWPTTSQSSAPPAFPQGEPRPSVMEIQAQLTHLQEEETGPERGSDRPQLTQPACGSAKPGSGSSGQDFCPWGRVWECPQFLVSSLGAPSIFQIKREALKTGFVTRLGHLLSSAAPHSTPGEPWDSLRGCPSDNRLLFLSDGEKRHEKVVTHLDLEPDCLGLDAGSVPH